MIMGCYGIGIGRTVAACIEQNNDADGILWPMSLAPFHVMIVPVNVQERTIMEVADKLYESMMNDGIDVLLDDRDERAGVKFKDADLVGIPLRITLGAKNLSQGTVELKRRRKGENILCPVNQIVEKIKEIIAHEMDDRQSS